ncbi:hypothetical protein E4M02_12510 [Brevundimonas sp. S30B]|nr:hypothetical protein E4M01_00570 [Brevundimonas sp. MF30-B]TFW01088.1 hypothetical protein E4M02_12510 [Brevundimonas sp. S30B]
MNRLLLLSTSLAAGLLLSACAGAGATNRYQAELDRLEADCQARRGALTPTGASTGYAARDFACRINEAPSRIEDRPR